MSEKQIEVPAAPPAQIGESVEYTTPRGVLMEVKKIDEDTFEATYVTLGGTVLLRREQPDSFTVEQMPGQPLTLGGWIGPWSEVVALL